MHFVKYHGLGNDYIVLERAHLAGRDPGAVAAAICDRHRGVGGDGILIDESGPDGFAVDIFNPDGSVAEKSGNGLRIFARYLFDHGRVAGDPFAVRTRGGDVTCRVLGGGGAVVVDMGRVCFDSALIPVLGARREVVDEEMTVGGRVVRYCAVTLGNPHCVVLNAQAEGAEALALGPLIEHEPRFPRRTNVQFLRVIDRATLRIEIWERGAGYTLASGSSSCAAAAAARRLDWCDERVIVRMPGGELRVELAPLDRGDGAAAPEWLGAAFTARLTGPVARVCAGEFFEPEAGA